MKDVMKENLSYLWGTVKDIGVGIWCIVNGLCKTVYSILIFWCAIWCTFGRALVEVYDRFHNWTEKVERNWQCERGA